MGSFAMAELADDMQVSPGTLEFNLFNFHLAI